MSTLPPIGEDHEAQLRSRMLKRLAVAGAMVLILLGVLAFFDYLATPEDNDAKVFSRPVPVPPKKEMTQPVKPNTELPEPPKPEPAPAKTEEVLSQPPAPPEVGAQPAVPEVVPGKAPVKATPIRPAVPGKAAEAAVRPQPSGKPAPPPVPEGTAAPTGRPAESTAPTRPPQETAAAQPRPAQPVLAAPPPLPRLLRGYVVQAGVFSNARAAEELHAKLALNGIPSTLEARVQIGPFKTKAEADAAREKLKGLGIEGLLIPPTGGRK